MAKMFLEKRLKADGYKELATGPHEGTERAGNKDPNWSIVITIMRCKLQHKMYLL